MRKDDTLVSRREARGLETVGVIFGSDVVRRKCSKVLILDR